MLRAVASSYTGGRQAHTAPSPRPPGLMCIAPLVLMVLVLAGSRLPSATAATTEVDAEDCGVLFSWQPVRDSLFPYTTNDPCTFACEDLRPRINCSRTGRIIALRFEGSQLAGSLPAQWGKLTSLQYLYLSSNNLTGTLPAEWGSMASLQHLYLGGNKLTGSLQSGWSNLRNIQTLHLDSNLLTGTLPPQWGSMTTLQYLYLGHNRMAGVLPAEWSGMTSVKTLGLSYNMFTGSLPANWGTLGSLTIMYLGVNSLSGTLPAQWGAMINLQSLYLSFNKLAGTLPTEWASMRSLQYLNLSRNNLEGTVPQEWATTGISQLYLDGNRVCGNVSFNDSSSNLPDCSTLSAAKAAEGQSSTIPKATAKSAPPMAVIIGGAAGAAALLAILIASVVIVRRHGCGRLKPPSSLLPVVAKDTAVDSSPTEAPTHLTSNTNGAMQNSGDSLSQSLRTFKHAPCVPHTGKQPGAPRGTTTSGRVSKAVTQTRTAPEPSAPLLDTAVAGTSPITTQPPAAVFSQLPAVGFISPQSSAAAAKQLGATVTPKDVRSAANQSSLPGVSSAAPQHAAGTTSGTTSFHLSRPAAASALGSGAQGQQLALLAASRPGGDGAAGMGVAAAMGVGIILPKCMQLASNIIAAGERVVANNARCSHLVARVTAMQPLLQKLSTDKDKDRDGNTPQEDAEALAQVLANIHQVFSDVHGCISAWCSPSRKGAIVTVIRNMVASSWFQEGFLELNMRLSGAFTDLSTAMHIQDWSARQAVDRSQMVEESLQQTKEDLQGLVQELVAVDESGQDQWSALEPEDKQRVGEIFQHHHVDLTTTLKKARAEALDQRVKGFLIPPEGIVKTRMLGKGGYGEVHEGLWQGHIPVALKTLLVGVMTERDMIDIMREAYIHHSAHNHPNVCQLYGLVLQKPMDCVLVMELLPSNMQQLLSDDDVVLTLKDKYVLALGAASGMAHLHSKSIVHGDLKPSNLLVDDRKRVAVSDFGLSSISCVTLTASTLSAKNFLSSASTGLSIWYSPPELLSNVTTKKTPAGDVYAFGIVLFEIFTRGVPYGMSDYDVVMRLVLAGERPKIPEKVPSDLAALICSCWAQEPVARPSFAMVVEKLKEMLANCTN